MKRIESINAAGNTQSRSSGDPGTPQAVAFYEKAQPTMEYLAGRWQDEREYEDIADYAKPLQKLAKAAGVEIVKMTKRPFGCIFTVGGKRFALTIGKYYAYKRVA